MTDEAKHADDAHHLSPAEEAAHTRKAEGKQTALEAAAEAEANASHEDKAKALIASYEHGLKHNSPRTSAELAEIKALLGAAHDKGDHAGV